MSARGFGNLTPLGARVSANVTYTTATVSIVTGLSINLQANTNYIFFFYFQGTNASSSSFAPQFHALAAGATISWLYSGCQTGAGTFGGTSSNGSATGTDLFTAVTATPFSGMANGVIVVGGTATTLQIDGHNPAALGTATVLAGTLISCFPVA